MCRGQNRYQNRGMLGDKKGAMGTKWGERVEKKWSSCVEIVGYMTPRHLDYHNHRLPSRKKKCLFLQRGIKKQKWYILYM